ncbi:MAG TPA: asparagine synthase-related protein, partial [Bryobacteraceae bacterium]|nr:asparagine synthase-related protein [Bryobacteraceae bacterium]
PPDVVCRPGEPRRLMRRAFADLLPTAILRRRSKAAFGGVYRQALRPMAAEALRDPAGLRCVEFGFAEAVSLYGRLQAFLDGVECNEYQLRQILLLEFWLRNRWERGVNAPRTGGRTKAFATGIFAMQANFGT